MLKFATILNRHMTKKLIMVFNAKDVKFFLTHQ